MVRGIRVGRLSVVDTGRPGRTWAGLSHRLCCTLLLLVLVLVLVALAVSCKGPSRRAVLIATTLRLLPLLLLLLAGADLAHLFGLGGGRAGLVGRVGAAISRGQRVVGESWTTLPLVRGAATTPPAGSAGPDAAVQVGRLRATVVCTAGGAAAPVDGVAAAVGTAPVAVTAPVSITAPVSVTAAIPITTPVAVTVTATTACVGTGVAVLAVVPVVVLVVVPSRCPRRLVLLGPATALERRRLGRLLCRLGRVGPLTLGRRRRDLGRRVI